jgi:hypothetical protein
MTKTTEIFKLQETMKTMEQVIPHIDHFFSDNVYGRLCIMEADDRVIGKVHKTNHLSILLEGTATISSKYGTATYKAPHIIYAFKGDKRAVLAHTKVKYLTIHVTDETDLDKLEAVTVEDK